MRNNQVLIKRVALHEAVTFNQAKRQSGNNQIRTLFKHRPTHPIVKNQGKLFWNQSASLQPSNNTLNSSQQSPSTQMNKTIKQMGCQNLSKNDQLYKVYNNNYKAFPKRQSFIKPSSKKGSFVANQSVRQHKANSLEDGSIRIANTLYFQFIQNPQKIKSISSFSHRKNQSSMHSVITPLSRQQSQILTPWDGLEYETIHL